MTATENTHKKRSRNVWGRRQNRPLNTQQRLAMETVFPQINIEIDDAPSTISPQSLFAAPQNETWMEIGFGQGEHVIGLLNQHTDINVIAAEPFLNGMAAYVSKLPLDDIPRTRVMMDDAMLLANALEDNSISQLYILNPDPWHKRRHYKRRIVSPNNLNTFARILKPGGKLIMTSDVLDLADWMLTHTYKHPDFTWDAQTATDWTTPPANWIPTRYETKGAKGAKKMCYLSFTRK